MKWKWNNYNIQHVWIIDSDWSVRKFINWAWYAESSLFRFFRWVCEQCHLLFSASYCVLRCETLFIICHLAKESPIANNDFFKIFSTLMKRSDVLKALFTWIIIEFDSQSSWRSLVDNNQFFKARRNKLYKILRRIITKLQRMNEKIDATKSNDRRRVFTNNFW